MRVAIDTNVLLSGLFFNGNERRILEKALVGEITLVVAETVIEETLNNIRKKFYRHAEFVQAKNTLRALLENAEIVSIAEAKKHFVQSKANIRHENDAPVLAAYMHAMPDCLISGDLDFFDLKTPVGFKILRARQFLQATS